MEEPVINKDAPEFNPNKFKN